MNGTHETTETARFMEIKNAVAWFIKRKYKHRDLEDIIQEAFAFVWEHISEYDPAKGTLSGFACRGARFAATNYLRKEREMVQFPDKFDVEEETQTDPEAAVNQVREILSTLTGRLRDVVEYRLQGMTFVDMAETYGLTHQRWNQLYQDAIETMRNRM